MEEEEEEEEGKGVENVALDSYDIHVDLDSR